MNRGMKTLTLSILIFVTGIMVHAQTCPDAIGDVSRLVSAVDAYSTLRISFDNSLTRYGAGHELSEKMLVAELAIASGKPVTEIYGLGNKAIHTV